MSLLNPPFQCAPLRTPAPIKARTWSWLRSQLQLVEDDHPAWTRILQRTTPFLMRSALERAGYYAQTPFSYDYGTAACLADFRAHHVAVPDEFETGNEVTQGYRVLLLLAAAHNWRSMRMVPDELDPLTPLREIARAAG